MSFLTDRKRAVGMGASHVGTHHHWSMTVSSVGLLILVPLFVFTFGPMLGAPHAEVAAFFARPFPAIVAALTFVVGFMHFKNGVQVAIEDYTSGMTRKILIIAMICLSYGAAATGVFAVARLAL
ncbi:succinate dehydrogenase, hydrophobic membrane anchor protein [Actibacterium lipolyticum]|uniref:Succinate dehydrogenase hydrophobic membrane anchor subunit n=1 Tax=Actibacterium lipolyticum TaxID=1524263 RepID=A0A238JMP4_9RHOB|nr:succinate dehydrogenase, hydrophobic membrane anchor protein [Actibacterium lipolyticum]SMX31152.1 Succinate dehydrogenase/Fumarate reductase transmembrane subunit [Actibacterium lipolyticum]